MGEKKRGKLEEPHTLSLHDKDLPSGHEQSIILGSFCDSHPASMEVKLISTTQDKQKAIAFILQKTPAP